MATVGSAGWDLPDDVSIKEVTQWGWIVHQDDKEVKIADTYADEEWYGVTAIPRGCVIEITELDVGS